MCHLNGDDFVRELYQEKMDNNLLQLEEELKAFRQWCISDKFTEKALKKKHSKLDKKVNKIRNRDDRVKYSYALRVYHEIGVNRVMTFFQYYFSKN
jgi:hypothetical protein